MEESGRPFDHDWGPLLDKDFESKPIFHSELIDTDMNGFTDLDEPMESSSPEMEFRGSIAERRAATFGFDASRINVAQFRMCSSPSSSSPSRSPYLTIPPGISPAALLESPVMLPNSQIQSSPTTGTFPPASANHDSLTAKPVSPSGTDEVKDSPIDSFAKFKRPGDPATQMPCAYSSVENQAPQASKSPAESGKEASVKSCDMSKSTKAVNMTRNATDLDMKPCNSNIADSQIPRFRECIKKETGAHHPLVEDQKATGLSTAGMTRNADDGYCWRKYGQKHVKGSEYPRSYYKCNNSNCLVKKKVERSHDGEITEIIYKGAHNHPKPQPRLSLGRQASSGELLETSDGIGSCPKLEGGAGWRYNQLSAKDFGASPDWRIYGLERTSSASFLHDITDPISTSQGKSGSVFGSVENPELCSSIANNEGEDEDGATQGSTSPGEDADGDESEPKRRKKEIFSAEAYLPSRSTREPRIILQIESEIDVLDDGYRWRKYGQKVVKGNPNPRSYYKCTSAGCPVRKHVERASEDIKSVITTYEGKHNHEVPTAKTNGGTVSIGNSPPNVSDPHSILTLPRNPNVSNPEMQVQDLPLHYQMKPNDFSQANLLGDLVSDMKLGAAAIYQMNFPPLKSPMSYGPFVMNSNGSETHTSCIAAPVIPEFPMAVPMSIPRSVNVAVNSCFHSNNHSTINGSVQSSVGNQQMKETDLRFFKPKEEQKDDHLYDSCLATPPDNANATSSTVFCRGAIGSFPS